MVAFREVGGSYQRWEMTSRVIINCHERNTSAVMILGLRVEGSSHNVAGT